MRIFVQERAANTKCVGLEEALAGRIILDLELPDELSVLKQLTQEDHLICSSRSLYGKGGTIMGKKEN